MLSAEMAMHAPRARGQRSWSCKFTVSNILFLRYLDVSSPWLAPSLPFAAPTTWRAKIASWVGMVHSASASASASVSASASNISSASNSAGTLAHPAVADRDGPRDVHIPNMFKRLQRNGPYQKSAMGMGAARSSRSRRQAGSGSGNTATDSSGDDTDADTNCKAFSPTWIIVAIFEMPSHKHGVRRAVECSLLDVGSGVLLVLCTPGRGAVYSSTSFVIRDL